MSPIEDKWWSAKEWSERTNWPYRSILDAAKEGALTAKNPSRRPGGKLLISESAWSAWLETLDVEVTVPGRVARGTKSSGRRLEDLAL